MLLAETPFGIVLWLESRRLPCRSTRPYAVVVPYSTWESEASSVVQLMVAELAVIPEALILEITGGALSTVTLTAADVAVFPAASRATAVRVCCPLLAAVVVHETA